MRITFLILMAGILMLAGCGGTLEKPTNANTAAANNATDPVATEKKDAEATTNDAPTLSAVVKAYCEAWEKNDEAALKTLFSKDTLQAFDKEMKADKVTSLLKFLEDDRITGKPCEVRNEEIKGDTAVAEFKASKYPNGIKIVFVKEDGEWKWTTRSPSIDAVANTASNTAANTAK
jgi:predicted lipid-binding transport protein (Tim44 family)